MMRREAVGRAHFPFVVRDPLLGEIELTEPEQRALDSDAFQRQRGVKQLGTSMFVYPSAVQSRFVHALGNLQLIDRMLRAAIGNADDQDRDAFEAACASWLRMSVTTQEERETLLDQLRIIV